MEFKTIKYQDAVRLNDIMFTNYVAKLSDTGLLQKLLEEIERAFDILEKAAIDFEEGVVARVEYICEWIKKEFNWKDHLSQTLILLYELKKLLPPKIAIEGQDHHIIISHPADLGVIKHEEGEKDGVLRFEHGTASYLNFDNVNPNVPYSLPVTNLILAAANDLRLADEDREFIRKIIE
jgi:hypothetical protein